MTNSIPWFAYSPSPFSVLMYIVMIIYAAWKIGKSVNRSRLLRLTDGFFVSGLAVLPTDAAWVLASAVRWGPLFNFEKHVWPLILCFGRDVAGTVFCLMFVYWLFQQKILKVTKITVAAYILNAVYLVFWFGLSSSPEFTDWTFALRHNAAPAVVLQSFVLSHIIGRIVFMPIFLSLFKSGGYSLRARFCGLKEKTHNKPKNKQRIKVIPVKKL